MPAKPTFTLAASAKIGTVNFPFPIRIDFARVPKDVDINELAARVAKRVLVDSVASAPVKTQADRELVVAYRQWRKENPGLEVTDPYDD